VPYGPITFDVLRLKSKRGVKRKRDDKEVEGATNPAAKTAVPDKPETGGPALEDR
jgi:hypothetical protein